MTPKFRDIQEFFDFLPEGELDMTQLLMELVEELVPEAKLKLRYNVPYYHRNKAMCFIWPSSVLWGNSPSYSGVRFGFVKGYLINDPIGFLSKGNRKQVFWIDFQDSEHLNQNLILLKDYILEAILIDNQL